MSEEILDQTDGTSSDTSSESSNSSNITDDSALQGRMNGDNDGYWMDKGYGSYINPTDGEPIHDAQGMKINNPEALKAYLKTQNATKQPEKQVQTPATFNNDKNGKVNPVVNKAMDFSYESSFAKAAVQPASTTQVQQPAVEQAPDFKTEYKDYAANANSVWLAPLERAINAMTKAGLYTNDNPDAVALSEEYEAKKEQVKEHLDDKYFEMREKHFEAKANPKDEAKAFATLKAEGDQVFGKVAAENGGVDVLEKLLFGQDVGGKHQKGPGSDLIYLLFDRDHIGKEVKDFGSELKKWWPTVAKDEGALRTLTALAHAVNTVRNQSNDRAAVRKQTLAEVAQQRKFTKPSSNGTMTGSRGGMSSADAALARFAGYDTV